MTAQEYKKLKRFPQPENANIEQVCNSLQLEEGRMFEIQTLQNQRIYAKITAAFQNLLFDIRQTTADGADVRCPLYAYGITKRMIAERILEGDWRVKE